jgi:hypothetical protein
MLAGSTPAQAIGAVTIDPVACSAVGDAVTVNVSSSSDFAGDTLTVTVDGTILGASAPAIAGGETLSFSGTYTPVAAGPHNIRGAVTDGASIELSAADMPFTTGAPGSCGGGGGGPVLTAPAAIANLAGTAGDQQITLTWSAPADGGDAIVDYIVEMSEAGGPYAVVNDGTNPATGAVVTGLLNGTNYTARVAAVNMTGTAAWSNITGTLTPAAPTPPATTPSQEPSNTPSQEPSNTPSQEPSKKPVVCPTGYNLVGETCKPDLGEVTVVYAPGPKGGTLVWTRTGKAPATSTTVTVVGCGMSTSYTSEGDSVSVPSTCADAKQTNFTATVTVSAEGASVTGTGTFSYNTTDGKVGSPVVMTAVRDLAVTPTPKTLTVTWKAPKDGEPTGYRVSATDGARPYLIKTVAGLSHTFTGLTPGKRHIVTVTPLIEGAGPTVNGPDSTTDGTTIKPTLQIVQDYAADGQATLVANAVLVTDVSVQRRTLNGDWVSVRETADRTTDGDAITFTVALKNTRTLRLVGVDPDGDPIKSETVKMNQSSRPKIEVTTAVNETADGMLITWSDLDAQGLDVNGYTVASRAMGAFGGDGTSVKVGATATTATLTSLKAGLYQVTVTAKLDSGEETTTTVSDILVLGKLPFAVTASEWAPTTYWNVTPKLPADGTLGLTESKYTGWRVTCANKNGALEAVTYPFNTSTAVIPVTAATLPGEYTCNLELVLPNTNAGARQVATTTVTLREPERVTAVRELAGTTNKNADIIVKWDSPEKGKVSHYLVRWNKVGKTGFFEARVNDLTYNITDLPVATSYVVKVIPIGIDERTGPATSITVTTVTPGITIAQSFANADSTATIVADAASVTAVSVERRTKAGTWVIAGELERTYDGDRITFKVGLKNTRVLRLTGTSAGKTVTTDEFTITKDTLPTLAATGTVNGTSVKAAWTNLDSLGADVAEYTVTLERWQGIGPFQSGDDTAVTATAAGTASGITLNDVPGGVYSMTVTATLDSDQTVTSDDVTITRADTPTFTVTAAPVDASDWRLAPKISDVASSWSGTPFDAWLSVCSRGTTESTPGEYNMRALSGPDMFLLSTSLGTSFAGEYTCTLSATSSMDSRDPLLVATTTVTVGAKPVSGTTVTGTLEARSTVRAAQARPTVVSAGTVRADVNAPGRYADFVVAVQGPDEKWTVLGTVRAKDGVVRVEFTATRSGMYTVRLTDRDSRIARYVAFTVNAVNNDAQPEDTPR